MSFADSLSTMDEGCERAILVGIQLKGDDASTLRSSLEELARLTDTAGAEVVATTYQKLDAPNPRTFVGSGKAEEIAEMCHAYAADIVIFDDELTPSQQSNLEKAVPKDVKVIDRTALILDIFALHATTKEGRLQVRLAQNQYLLPRLRGMWAHLASNRMGGGVGSRFGEGESQLEVDRRMVRKRITSIRRELEQVSRMLETQRSARYASGVFKIAEAGYTNAGKSSLINRLAGADVLSYDKLFATLDSTTRKLVLPEGREVTITDTVGFIRKLPHQLVEAFKATLEELEYADLLLHVIDVSNPEWQHQAEVVEKLIVELGANEIPRIDVFNKCDRVEAGDLRPHGADICSISARTGEGVDRLLEMIDRRLDKGTRRVTIHLPYDKGGLLDMLYREAKVESVEYSETIDIVAVCPPKVLGQIGDYTPDWTPPKEDWE